MFWLERLSDVHELDGFSSGHDELDAWLYDAARNADRAGTARVFVWVDADGAVRGYVAIAPHTIRRHEVPRAVGRGSPDSIPAFLLARLAIAKPLQDGSGRGDELLVDALSATLDAIRGGGGRLIVVDAIDARARRFYERNGFKPIPDNPDRLVMKASDAAASIGIAWP